MESKKNPSDDEKAIRQAIEQFIQGIRDLDAESIASVFHPDADSLSLTPRGICIEPAEAWPKIIEQAKAESTHMFREDFSVRILNIEVVGTVAAAKVEWTFESARIVDFYNMLKTEGKWLIVNQVYHTFRPGETD
jgi:ketosteroid isomerase-like protein